MKDINGITYTNDLKKCSHGDYGLYEANILDSVKVIKKNAFKDSCLRKVHFPEKLELIEEKAFDNIGLEEVILKKDVVVEEGAFSSNPMLTNIDISISEIPVSCFAYGDLYRTINLENTTIIQPGAFKNNNIEKISFPDTLETIYNRAFLNCKFKDTTLFLPKNLKFIGFEAFKHTNLTDIYLPDSVKQIQIAFVGKDVTVHVSPSLLEKLPELSEYKIKTLTLDDILKEKSSFKEINKFYKENDLEK